MTELVMHTPFDLNNPDLYARWRDIKLNHAPSKLEDISVEIRDPRNLTTAERDAILLRCQRTNMAIYISATGNDPDPNLPLELGLSFGLKQLDHNWLGDETGLTSLTMRNQGTRKNYIPYTNRQIRWHTDGYYNTPEQQIHGILLHCVESAENGGENALFDQELAYIILRDKNPDYIRALMAADVMTIPIRLGEDGSTREEQTGPVFAITPKGELHMRFTERKHNITWKDDPLVTEAITLLKETLNGDHPGVLTGRLESGMGLICNNVLHNRSSFDNQVETSVRLLYRGRYYDRIANTGALELLKNS